VLSGYVLIQTEVGMASGVEEALRAVDGVTSVDLVTGPYDVIATTEAAGMQELGPLMNRIQSVHGIARTLTCSVINS
jgi:hypothetical protein